MSDDAKRIVLARRRKFIAAAIASVGISCGPGTPEPVPRPCLSQPPQQPHGDAGAPGFPDEPGKKP